MFSKEKKYLRVLKTVLFILRRLIWSKNWDDHLVIVIQVEVQYMMIFLLVVLGVSGRVITEHRMTEEEPFSVCNVYWYNKYSDDPENPPTCTPATYRYHVIFTLSKDPDENVKEMIEKYVEDNNIMDLHRQDPSGICLHSCLYILFKYFDFLQKIFDILYLEKKNPVIFIILGKFVNI